MTPTQKFRATRVETVEVEFPGTGGVTDAVMEYIGDLPSDEWDTTDLTVEVAD